MYFSDSTKVWTTVVAIVLACLVGFEYFMFREDVLLGAFVLGLILTIGIVLALNQVKAGATVFTSAFVAVCVVPDMQLIAFIVLACVFVIVVAYSGRWFVSLFATLIVALCGIFDPEERMFIDGSSAILVWLSILTICFALGWIAGSKRRSQIALKKQQEIELSQQRQVFAISLHDSVISQLTSVVMKAEATSSKHKDNPELSSDLAIISDSGRQALSQLRDLVGILRGEERSLLVGENDRVFEQYFRMKLGKHGFKVDGDLPALGAIGVLNRPDWSNLFRIVLTEVSTNIIKYAEPESVIRVSLTDRKDDFRSITFSNRIATKKKPNSSKAMTSGMGIESLMKQARILGAQITTRCTADEWMVDFIFPSNSQKTNSHGFLI